jgi:hypothetical protein
MADAASVLAAAVTERHQAELALDAHWDVCTVSPVHDCADYRRLAGQAERYARRVALLQWKQALSARARDKRNQRGRRPPPQITGYRIDPGRQP